jgi:hypothetical protein
MEMRRVFWEAPRSCRSSANSCLRLPGPPAQARTATTSSFFWASPLPPVVPAEPYSPSSPARATRAAMALAAVPRADSTRPSSAPWPGRGGGKGGEGRRRPGGRGRARAHDRGARCGAGAGGLARPALPQRRRTFGRVGDGPDAQRLDRAGGHARRGRHRRCRAPAQRSSAGSGAARGAPGRRRRRRRRGGAPRGGRRRGGAGRAGGRGAAAAGGAPRRGGGGPEWCRARAGCASRPMGAHLAAPARVGAC